MACYICRNFNIFLYFLIVSVLVLFVNSANVGIDISDDLLSELYTSYKAAQHIDTGSVASRRVLSDNKKYQIHIMKLNEVNGNKRHNLLVREDNSSNPLIYIDNPVETKVPNAYLTFEEFKKELTERVLRLRKGFTTKTRFNTKPTAAKAKEEKEILKSFLSDMITERKKTGPEILHVLTDGKGKAYPNYIETTNVKPKNNNTIKSTTMNAKNQATKDTKLINKITEKASSQVAAKLSKSPVTIVNETSNTNKFTIETSLEAPNLTITEHPIITDELEKLLNVTSVTKIPVETQVTEEETSEVTIVTENPIEPEVTEQEMNDKYEPTRQLEVESPTASPATTTLTEKTTLSKERCSSDHEVENAVKAGPPLGGPTIYGKNHGGSMDTEGKQPLNVVPMFSSGRLQAVYDDDDDDDRPLVWMQPTENPEPNIQN